MLKAFLLTLSLVLGFCFIAKGQTSNLPSIDSLKRAVIELDQEIYEVKLNLHNSQKQLKTGILVATIGYTVTIIGGQLLGTEPDLGKTLLYVGGATGIAGTFILVKGFKKISLGAPAPPPNYYPNSY
ncbi:hypothetical protein [Algoriphagus marinus]|uniref:hypothetical protein n=1 Tax=Algoriphagus marinus TaxID=1925762 RepID=UPI00094BB3FD|nr:hypothetical protein [Algoriphagus marinus]